VHRRRRQRLVDVRLEPLLLGLALRRGTARDPSRRRLGAARGGGDDAHAVLGRLDRERPGDGVDAALGRGIRHPVDASGGDRGDVDDRAPACLDHGLEDRAAAVERGHQRPGDLRVDLLGGELLERLEPDGATLGVDPPGDGLADALRGAGDHHDLAGEPARGDERRTARGGLLAHGPPGGLVGPGRVLADQGASGVPVATLEGRHDVEVVLGAAGVAPGGVAQGLVHVTAHPEPLVGLEQVLVAGQREQVVVEGRVGLGVGRRVHEPVALDVGHGRLGEQAVARELRRGQPADGEGERPELQGLAGLEDRVGLPHVGVLLADLGATGAGPGDVGAPGAGRGPARVGRRRRRHGPGLVQRLDLPGGEDRLTGEAARVGVGDQRGGLVERGGLPVVARGRARGPDP